MSIRDAKFRKIRKQFPMLHEVSSIYLDSAATTHKCQSVIDTVTSFYAAKNATVHRAIYAKTAHASQLYYEARAKVQAFFHAASPDEIVFTRGTTDSINIVAASLGKYHIGKGDEILLTQQEHHSNIVPWQLIAEEKGAHIRVLPVHDDGTLDRSMLHSLLTPKTKIVACAHISNVIGVQNPIHEIIKAAHAAGAYVLIDGAQSAAHVPINLQELDADFFVCSSHKMYGPTGVGVLYGKKALLEEMPPISGGGDSIIDVTFEKTTFQSAPQKFEPGTPPIASVLGFAAAIDYLNETGMHDIHAWEHELATQALTMLLDLPVCIVGPHVPKNIYAFYLPNHHSLDLATLLDVRNIAVRSGHMCAQPLLRALNLPPLLRLSLAHYNTPDDLSQFASALRSALRAL